MAKKAQKSPPPDTTNLLTLSPTQARRLAITRQRLADDTPVTPDADGLLDVVRDLGCLQLDPTSAVEKNHLLVLWSRVGLYERAQVETLLWERRALFEYWAHAASIVLTEDYPVHAWMMRGFSNGDSPWSLRVREWMLTNNTLVEEILRRLTADGPLSSKAFDDVSDKPWVSTGWTGGRNVERALYYLWCQGRIMVAGRLKGGTRLWNLAERVLPSDAPRDELDDAAVTRRAVQTALRALGVATARQITQHYTRDRYPGLEQVLADLVTEGTIERVQIVDDDQLWPGAWYIHAADRPLLDRLAAGAWTPRTTLLSPFDNLICDRDRTALMWNFRFRLEIYTPKDKREYGYFVLPILYGDQLIGRIDPLMDRKKQRLQVHAVHVEPGAPVTAETGRAVHEAVERLGQFLGAREIVYGGQVPEGWRGALGAD